MKRLRILLVTTAMIVGCSALASAQGWGYPDRDRDRYYDRDGRAVANARNFGYQDGFNDGRNDRFTGHSFRPTQDRNFKHGDHGYYGGCGIDRDYYRQVYRQAYGDGYQRGYGPYYRRYRYRHHDDDDDDD